MFLAHISLYFRGRFFGHTTSYCTTGFNFLPERSLCCEKQTACKDYFICYGKRVEELENIRVEVLPGNNSYRKLTVYQKAKKLVLGVYSVTNGFPPEEKYSLVPQIRRAAISIVANLVEGYSKNSRKDFARFLQISIGSSTELELYLELSVELKYLSFPAYAELSILL